MFEGNLLLDLRGFKEGGDSSMFGKILFCTDFSENSDHAFSYAFNLATPYNATLLILHVIAEPFAMIGPHPKGNPYHEGWSRSAGLEQSLLLNCRRWMDRSAPMGLSFRKFHIEGVCHGE